jgi:hypothetical protein
LLLKTPRNLYKTPLPPIEKPHKTLCQNPSDRDVLVVVQLAQRPRSCTSFCGRAITLSQKLK